MSRSRSSCIRTGRPVFTDGQRHHRREGVALGLLAAKAATHPGRLDDDLVRGLRRAPRRRSPGSRSDAGSTSRRRPSRPPPPPPRPPGSRGRNAPGPPNENSPSSRSGAFARAAFAVAAGERMRRRVEASLRDRLPDTDQGRQGLVLDLHRRRRRAALALRPADDEGDHLPVVLYLVVGKERLVVMGADVVAARDILGQEDGDNPRHRAGLGRVPASDAGPRMRRAHRPEVKHRAALRGVVGIERPARDVPDRALVAERPRRVGRQRVRAPLEIELPVLGEARRRQRQTSPTG